MGRVMHQRRTVACTLIVIAIALFVMVIRNGGAPPGTSRRASLPHRDRAGGIRAVNLRPLDLRRPQMESAARDPFAFFHRPRVASTLPTRATTHAVTTSNALPPPVSPPVPELLPVRFVGTLHKLEEAWAVFSDCAGYIRATAEGDRVLGVWRLEEIGIASVRLESIDGQQVTVRMTGCPTR